MTKSERLNKICKNYIIACDLFNEENTLYKYRFFSDNKCSYLYLDLLVTDECYKIPLDIDKMKILKVQIIKNDLDLLCEYLVGDSNEN